MHPKIISLFVLVCTVSAMESTASDLKHGPYEVGFETYKTYDDSRPYMLGDDTISRPLLIHFWYPSKDKGLGQTLSFKHYIDLISQREDHDISSTDIDANSFNYIHAYSEFAKRNLGLDTCLLVQEILETPVYARSGIPLQSIVPGSPLLIYAPSNSKSSVQNHMICEYLASHGFMILSVGSAGPSSMQRQNFNESTMAQVFDMEQILKYAEEKLGIRYTSLGLFGFSSGGNAMSLFQMRNERVEAVFSLDGGQEYGVYPALYRMTDFDLKKANIPYCSVVNNYENFSIYPYYNSVPADAKFLLRMPYLDHNGFISHWHFFESCSPHPTQSHIGKSYDIICDCALEFFRSYLGATPTVSGDKIFGELDTTYIQLDKTNHSTLAAICNALSGNNLDAAKSLVDENESELLAEETQIGILSRMFIDSNIDQALWLCQVNAEYHPESWKAHYDLAYIYKEKGETLLSKASLSKAESLNADNQDIADLQDELDKME